jgi:hypothetical protein
MISFGQIVVLLFLVLLLFGDFRIILNRIISLFANFKAIFLKDSKKISDSLKIFFNSMDNFTTVESKDSRLEISAKISEINKIKDSSIETINQEYIHYTKGRNLIVVQGSDVKNFINYLADEYINEIIERIYVGTFKYDVKKLIDEIHKEGGGDVNIKDSIINKIISDAKIKAELELIEKKGRLTKIIDSDDENIETLLSNNKSIFSFKLKKRFRLNYNVLWSKLIHMYECMYLCMFVCM